MSVKKGREYEKRACEFLQSLGFVIVEQNFYSRYGEIDIIAYKEGVLHFVEVKGSAKNNPIEAVTPQKIKRLLKTIDSYWMKHQECLFCLDVIVICGKEVSFYENIVF